MTTDNQTSPMLFCDIKRLSSLNNPKDLDPSYKTDLDFWIILEGKISGLYSLKYGTLEVAKNNEVYTYACSVRLQNFGGEGRVVRWPGAGLTFRAGASYYIRLESRARVYCTCNRCSWGLFGHFSLVFFVSSFSLSLGDGPIWTEILSQRAVKPKATQSRFRQVGLSVIKLHLSSKA